MKDPRTQAIIRIVGHMDSVTVTRILSPRRGRTLVRSRQLAMYLAREHTDLSFPKLAQEFGRDHSTVHHAVAKIQRELDDPNNHALCLRHRVAGYQVRRLKDFPAGNGPTREH